MERETRRPSIVVIDSSELVLAVTRAELESAGYRVATHARTAGAVALILQEKPDLVLLEVSMGGDSVAKLFGKAQPNGSTIVLLYSAMSAEALAAKVAACGAHGYIRKTPDGVDFIRQINGWMRKSVANARSKATARFDDDDYNSRPSGSRLAVADPRHTDASDPPRASGTMLIDERIVLFIDDDMETLSNFRREVQRESYTAEFALSGTRGLRRILSASPPDLVVCDLEMQDLDGLAVYHAALATDLGWRTRFLFLSDTFFRRSKLELAGFDGVVLDKPVSGQALRAAIRAGLSSREPLSASGSG
jgi:DNA-binding response OmpR family regulator